MVRNIMGCLVAVGSGRRAPLWLGEVLAGRRREAAAPTFAADGLYFVGPYYDARHALPPHNPNLHWLP
jgi:tRNA pseudouridine38-40 synthase